MSPHAYRRAILGVVLAAVTALLVEGCDAAVTPAPPDPATHTVALLADGLSLERVDGLLGRPADISRPAGPFVEKLWINDTYAVQAVVGPAQEILGYSVTTLSDAFHPPVPLAPGAVLGSTPLGRYPDGPEAPDLVAAAGVSNHGVWYYSEGMIATGASRDRTPVLTASDASQVGVTSALQSQLNALTPSGLADRGPFQNGTAPGPPTMREGIVPTTYTVLGPKLAPEQLPHEFRFGPTTDDLLAVHPNP